MEKLLTMCCRLSREAWIVHTASAKGKVFIFKRPVTPVELFTFTKLPFAGNSKQKWENMLTEITNMEYMVVKCQSVIRKLYPNIEDFEINVSLFFYSHVLHTNYVIDKYPL